MSDGYTYTATVSIRGYDGLGGEVLKDERTLESNEDLDAVIEVANSAITQYKLATGSLVEPFPERKIAINNYFIPVMFIVNSYEEEGTAAAELREDLEQFVKQAYGEYDANPADCGTAITIQKFATPNHDDDPETFLTTIDLRDAAGYGAALLLGIDIDAIKAEAKEQA